VLLFELLRRLRRRRRRRRRLRRLPLFEFELLAVEAVARAAGYVLEKDICSSLVGWT